MGDRALSVNWKQQHYILGIVAMVLTRLCLVKLGR